MYDSDEVPAAAQPDLERRVVEPDPDLIDLIPDYLEHRRQDLLAMTHALEQSDLETVRVLGHSMKGCGASYGFEGPTTIGASLEDAAKAADSEAARSHLG